MIEPLPGLLYSAVGALYVREFFGFMRWLIRRRNGQEHVHTEQCMAPGLVGGQQGIQAALNGLAGQIGAVHLELVRSHVAASKVANGNKALRAGLDKNLELCTAILREVQRGSAHKP